MGLFIYGKLFTVNPIGSKKGDADGVNDQDGGANGENLQNYLINRFSGEKLNLI
jgi:hypothetical protein